jgi:ABC-type dipeptide/oligopeptide/nickel transport system permease component
MIHALRTVSQSAISLVLLFIFVFVLIRIIPGDPARLMAGVAASDEQIELIRIKLGLNLPIWEQLLGFVSRLLTGDLGTSTLNGRAVWDQILSGLSYSVPLAGAGMALAAIIGVPAGVIAALHSNRTADVVVTTLTVATTSLPAFWFALVLIDWFSVNWRLLPSSGAGTWRHIILPAIVLSATQIGLIARLTRGSVIEVLSSDYVRTARSKGATPRRVLFSHILPNAAVPTITVIGLQTGIILGGAVVTETVFNWPGVGRLLIQGVLYRDYAVIQGLVLLFGTTFLLINLVVDLLNMTIDPRLRR